MKMMRTRSAKPSQEEEEEQVSLAAPSRSPVHMRAVAEAAGVAGSSAASVASPAAASAQPAAEASGGTEVGEPDDAMSTSLLSRRVVLGTLFALGLYALVACIVIMCAASTSENHRPQRQRQHQRPHQRPPQPQDPKLPPYAPLQYTFLGEGGVLNVTAPPQSVAPRLSRGKLQLPLFNPSVVGGWQKLRGARRVLVTARWLSETVVSESVQHWYSTVLLRELEIVQSFHQPLVAKLDHPFAWIAAEPRKCPDHLDEPTNCGMEDARAVVVPGSGVAVVVNEVHPRTALRRMAVAMLDIGELLQAVKGNGRALTPRRLTFLEPPRNTSIEKNWMPFVGEEGRLRFIYNVEPHIILDCDLNKSVSNGKGGAVGTPSSTSACKVVANTSWSSLYAELNTGGQPLLGSTSVLDRGDGGDLVTCAHWHEPGNNDKYWFVCYTFERALPHSITGCSRPFRFVQDPDLQYLSGLALVEDVYIMTYSVMDRSIQSRTLPRDKLDKMMRALAPPSRNATLV